MCATLAGVGRPSEETPNLGAAAEFSAIRFGMATFGTATFGAATKFKSAMLKVTGLHGTHVSAMSFMDG